MAYTDILILRHLASRPSHGYELRKRIETTTGIVLNTNSLYPALHRFVDAGAVEMTVEIQDSKPPRHVYEITDVGRELLHDLVADLPPALASDEVEFLTRLGQFGSLTPAERLVVIMSREEAVLRSMAHFDQLSGRTSDDYWTDAALAIARSRAEAELAWMQDLRAEAQHR